MPQNNAKQLRAWLAWAALMLACGPDVDPRDEITDEPRRYAAAVCGASQECGCYPHLATETDCEAELMDRFASLAEDLTHFDKECFDAVISEERLASGCATHGELAEMETGASWSCMVLHGDKELGEACMDRLYDLQPFWASECADGLACQDGECVREGALGPQRPLGAACPEGWQASCHNGLMCIDGTCQEPPALTEACMSPFDCGSGDNYCQGWAEAGVGVCAPTLDQGESCDPRDWFACGVGDSDDGTRPWCDPQLGVCVQGAPAICSALDFPRARGDI